MQYEELYAALPVLSAVVSDVDLELAKASLWCGMSREETSVQRVNWGLLLLTSAHCRYKSKKSWICVLELFKRTVYRIQLLRSSASAIAHIGELDGSHDEWNVMSRTLRGSAANVALRVNYGLLSEVVSTEGCWETRLDTGLGSDGVAVKIARNPDGK